MDALIVVASMVGVVLLWGWLNRPGAPDPENIEEAPQVIVEGTLGLAGVTVLGIIAVGAVLLLGGCAR
jgi:hypothetical protein